MSPALARAGDDAVGNGAKVFRRLRLGSPKLLGIFKATSSADRVGVMGTAGIRRTLRRRLRRGVLAVDADVRSRIHGLGRNVRQRADMVRRHRLQLQDLRVAASEILEPGRLGQHAPLGLQEAQRLALAVDVALDFFTLSAASSASYFMS